MVEEIFSFIYVLLVIVLIVSDFLEPAQEDQTQSELHSSHRYAVADQIMRHRYLYKG